MCSEMKLGILFQNGAVLQRNILIPVWGETKPNCRLRGELGGNSVWTVAAADGHFMMRFPAMPAGGPHSLLVENTTTGEKINLEGIMIGEVWLASGQSNMDYKLGTDWAINPTQGEEQLNSRQLREFCKYDHVPEKFRYIVVPSCISGSIETSFRGEWVGVRSGTASSLSAAAAWFGYYLRKNLDVPVGIIVSASGGTRVEAWTSRSGIMRVPEMQPLMQQIDALHSIEEVWGPPQYESAPDYLDVPENKGLELGWAEPDFDDSQALDYTVPGSWKKQKLAGNGVIWARRTIEIPEEWAGKELVLHLGGIDKTDITYFNGVEIGRTGIGKDTKYWDVHREYVVPGELVKGGRAVIAIRAYSFNCDGSINGSSFSFMLSQNGRADYDIPLAGTWKLLTELDLGDIQNPNQGSKYEFGPGMRNTPSILFNGMINPLIPYAMRGVIWYQGESNAWSCADSSLYGERLRAMIEDWRYQWGQVSMPFIQVQLACFKPQADYDENESWVILREKQLEVARSVPDVHIVSAIDVGDADDIHPQDKKSVGFRLAENALRNVYHLQGHEGEGPRYERCEYCGGSMRLLFSNCDGLCLKGDDAARGFFVAGSDKVFHPADSVMIDGVTVVVGSSQVKHPVAVRYAWSANPVNSLYNGAGLPASPFRTDSWKLV